MVPSAVAKAGVLALTTSLAVEWGALESAPKLALLPGERHRERVITPDEEMRYLAAASPLLADVASVLADTGLRPDECYQLRWENVTWVNGRNGSLLITHGKTAAARRALPMTPRVRAVLESRWNAAGKPSEGWAWPAPTRSEHIDHSSLKKQHAKAFRAVNREAKKNSLKPIAPFAAITAKIAPAASNEATLAASFPTSTATPESQTSFHIPASGILLLVFLSPPACLNTRMPERLNA